MSFSRNTKVISLNIALAGILALSGYYFQVHKRSNYAEGRQVLQEKGPEESREYFEAMLKTEGGYEALYGKAWSLWVMGDVDGAEAICQVIASDSPEGWLLASNHFLLGQLDTRRGNQHEALVHFTEAFAVYKTLEGNETNQIKTLLALVGNCLLRDDLVCAEDFLDQAEHLPKALEDYRGRFWRLRGNIALAERNFADGKEHSLKAYAVYQEQGNKTGAATALSDLGFFRIATGEIERGLADTESAREVMIDLGAKTYNDVNRLLASVVRGAPDQELLDEIQTYADDNDDESLKELLALVMSFEPIKSVR